MVEMVLLPNLAANEVMATRVTTTMARALFMYSKSLYSHLCKVVSAGERPKSNILLYSRYLESYGAGHVGQDHLAAKGQTRLVWPDPII
jgi:hypothetical protein